MHVCVCMYICVRLCSCIRQERYIFTGRFFISYCMTSFPDYSRYPGNEGGLVYTCMHECEREGEGRKEGEVENGKRDSYNIHLRT